MKVKDVMISKEKFPIVGAKAILKEALTAMGDSNLGLVCIINNERCLLGLITDGDIRRKLLRVQKPFSAFFVDDAIFHAKTNPLVCNPNDDLKKAVKLMGDKKVWDLPVVDQKNELVGLLHLHPAIKKLLHF